MAGPVGILGMRELAVVPIAEDSAPMTADRRIIGSRRRVHCLAATAGAMSMALMRIMPTAWMEKKDGDRGKEREEYIQLAPRKSENCGIVRIKSHKFQFFSEKENQEKGKNRNGSCEKDVAVKNSGCLSENELIQSGLVGISCMLDDGRQNETRAEKEERMEARTPSKGSFV